MPSKNQIRKGSSKKYPNGLPQNVDQPAKRRKRRFVEAILVATGVPAESTPEYSRLANQVRERVCACEWSAVPDDSTPFTESPEALMQWAPVVDEYKGLDREIVVNSVRFRWQDVRRDLRRHLNAKAVLSATS